MTDEVLVALRRIMRGVDLHSRALMTSCGLTAPQLIVLRELAEAKLPVGVLARRVSLGQATVTGIVDRLQARGLVERIRSDEDRRSVIVAITRDGRRIVRKAPSLMQDRFQREFASLQPWEQSQILSSLQRVVSMMETPDDEEAPMLGVTMDVVAPGRDA
ncbi:MAG: MarR family transcriptional regulator [Phycisphaera sp.]|nr:MarR family transcriptional regulator [Phycisphaera sp.]